MHVSLRAVISILLCLLLTAALAVPASAAPAVTQSGSGQAVSGAAASEDSGTASEAYTGLAKTACGWLYFKDGEYDASYRGIVSNAYGKWYLESGTVAWDYTGLAAYKGQQWYIKYGQVDESYTGMLYDDDTWYFITDGIATWHYTGSAEKLTYGTSESGRPLTVYRFGTGSKVLLLTFAVHGYEDAYTADGSALVYAAFRLMRVLDEHADLISSGSWSIYIVPCANPDGLLDGTGSNGPGRLTTGSSSADGTRYSAGIDINRSFPYIWRQYTESRNYNGRTSLFSSEARALYKLVTSIQGKSSNLCIDVHGWYNQIVATSESSGLYQILHAGFPYGGYASLIGSYGYFSAWAYSIGYQACLFEFPAGIHSLDDFRNSGYSDRFNTCILNLLKKY